MVDRVHPGLPRTGKSGHDGGQPACRVREVFRGSKSKTATVLTRGTRQTLVRRCDGGLSSRGPAGNRQNQNMMAGQPAFRAGKFSWAARAKRRRHHRQALPPVLRFVIARQRFVHGSHAVNLALPGGRLSCKHRGHDDARSEVDLTLLDASQRALAGLPELWLSAEAHVWRSKPRGQRYRGL